MRRFNTLDLKNLETSCILPLSDSKLLAASETISMGQRDNKTEELDDGWMLLSGPLDDYDSTVGRHVEAQSTTTVASSPSGGRLGISQPLELPFDLNNMLKDQYDWTTGEEDAITHRQIIDGGASGEVHEVCPSLLSLEKVLIKTSFTIAELAK
jgi:hypothetical protein